MAKIGGVDRGATDRFEGRDTIDQRNFTGNLKYHPDANVTIVRLGAGEFKACPPIDFSGDKPKLSKGCKNDEITWARAYVAANYVGFNFGDEHRKCIHFWVNPSVDSMLKYMPDLKEIKDPDGLSKEIINNSPYVRLWEAMGDTHMDMDVPDEWKAMTNKKEWLKILGKRFNIDTVAKKIYSAPLPQPQRQILVRCYLRRLEVKNRGKITTANYAKHSYDDKNKSNGSLHPTIAELCKTASDDFERLVRAENVDTGVESPIVGEMGELGNETVFSVEMSDPDDFAYSVFTNKDKRPQFTAAEILNEFHDFEKQYKIAGKQRAPIINVMSVDYHMKVLTQVFGPEVMDYAFKSTALEDALPEGVLGSFEAMLDKGVDWLTLVNNRITKKEKPSRRTSARVSGVASEDDDSFEVGGSELDGKEEAPEATTPDTDESDDSEGSDADDTSFDIDVEEVESSESEDDLTEKLQKQIDESAQTAEGFDDAEDDPF